jgi:hypothetical protein
LSLKSLSAVLGGRGRQSALLYVWVVTAAKYLAATSSGAFTRFETHELIDAADALLAIADRAKGIGYQPPGG